MVNRSGPQDLDSTTVCNSKAYADLEGTLDKGQ